MTTEYDSDLALLEILFYFDYTLYVAEKKYESRPFLSFMLKQLILDKDKNNYYSKQHTNEDGIEKLFNQAIVFIQHLNLDPGHIDHLGRKIIPIVDWSKFEDLLTTDMDKLLSYSYDTIDALEDNLNSLSDNETDKRIRKLLERTLEAELMIMDTIEYIYDRLLNKRPKLAINQ